MHISPKIPVLQAIRQGIIGGGESHVISVVENINRNIFNPVVLSFTDGPMVTTLTKMGVPVYVIPTTKPFDIRVWKQVDNLIEKEKIRLVHAHGTRAASNVFWGCDKNKVPLAYTIHGWSFHPDQSFLVKKLRIASERFITSKTTINISVSGANRASGEQNIKGFSSVLINYGIDLNKFNPDNTYVDLREQLGISKNVTLVGFIARMTYQKNPVKMVEAFGKAAALSEDIHLLMVGDGELKEQAISKAKDLKITQRITFMKFSQNVPAVLKACDIYCLPSFWEGLPIGLLEAMAMGKGVIASDVDGSAEVIAHRKNGFLIDPHNAEEISKAILELHYNEELLSLVQKAAAKTVREKFIDKKMTKEIEKVYFDCLSYPQPKQKEYEH